MESLRHQARGRTEPRAQLRRQWRCIFPYALLTVRMGSRTVFYRHQQLEQEQAI